VVFGSFILFLLQYFVNGLQPEDESQTEVPASTTEFSSFHVEGKDGSEYEEITLDGKDEPLENESPVNKSKVGTFSIEENTREKISYFEEGIDRIHSFLALFSTTSSLDLLRDKIILLSCLFMLFYSGTSIIYNQFMPSFLQTSLLISSLQASYIHSVLNYASTFSRAIGILIALRMSPAAMVIMNLSLFNIGSLFLLAFTFLPCTMIGTERGEIVSYVGNIIIGLGMGSVSAPLYSYLKKHCDVTNVTGSIFVFCNGFTSVFVPLIVASVMTKSSSFLLVFNLINISLSLVIFYCIIVKVRLMKNQPTFQNTLI
jgi:hypothetical protein